MAVDIIISHTFSVVQFFSIRSFKETSEYIQFCSKCLFKLSSKFIVAVVQNNFKFWWKLRNSLKRVGDIIHFIFKFYTI